MGKDLFWSEDNPDVIEEKFPDFRFPRGVDQGAGEEVGFGEKGSNLGQNLELNGEPLKPVLIYLLPAVAILYQFSKNGCIFTHISRYICIYVCTLLEMLY